MTSCNVVWINMLQLESKLTLFSWMEVWILLIFVMKHKFDGFYDWNLNLTGSAWMKHKFDGFYLTAVYPVLKD